MLSDRIQTLSPSLTIAISSLARDMKAEGKDVLSFSAGEPDFQTPQAIKDEAIKDINDGFRKVEDWANKVGSEIIEIKSENDYNFLNINTKEDLEEAKNKIK